ncbi:MAG: TolC family protein [Ignavibacterium sp.]
MKKIIIIYIVLYTTLSIKIFSQEILSLENAIQIGLENNYSIKIAKNFYKISENDVSIGNAGFLPTIDATSNYNESKTNTEQKYYDGRFVDRSNVSSDNFSSGIFLNWTIFDGFQMFTSFSKYKELKKIGYNNLKLQIENSIAEIISSYNNIIREKYIIEVIKRNIEISQERVKIAQDKLDYGSGSRFDLRQAIIDLNEDRSTYLEEERNLQQEKIFLNQLLGRDVEQNFEILDTIKIDTSLIYNDLYSIFLKNNNELLIAETNKNISQLDIKLIRSELFPELSINLGYNYNRSTSGAGIIEENKNYGFNYGISASLRLFDGLNRKRRLENSQLDYKNNLISYEEIKNNLSATFLDAYQRYKNALELIKLEKESLEAVLANIQIGLERLRLGNITPLEFRETQIQLIESESRLQSAMYQAKLAETDLLKLCGILVKNFDELN